MSVQIVVFNALGLLDAEIEREVPAGINDGIAAFSRHAEVDRIGIAVHLHGYVSEYTGLGGMSYGPDSFSLFVDDACKGLREDTRRRAAAVAVHELHHALRQRRLPTLRQLDSAGAMCAGDVLVLEGLAVRTEYFLGFGPSLNVHDVDLNAAYPLIERIAPIIDDPKGDWTWIEGVNDPPPPVYRAMYLMGYHVVETYLQERRCSPIEALHVPWHDIWHPFAKRFGLCTGRGVRPDLEELRPSTGSIISASCRTSDA